MQTQAPTNSVLLTDVSFSHGPLAVLVDVNLTLTSNSRLGVLGRNGSGKSTLFKLLARQLLASSGRVEYAPQDTQVGLLRQEHVRTDETVDSYLRRRAGVLDAERELDAASSQLVSDTSSAANERYDRALARFVAIGVADFESRLDQAMEEFGLSKRVRTTSIKALSGGELAKVNLASMIISRFDLLLLDEPTNDLDFAGLERLERFVHETNCGMALISHDRAFLRRTTRSIAEIDAHSHQLLLFNGGYESYLQEREVAHQHAVTRYEQYQQKRGELQDRIQQQREWSYRGVARATKSDEQDKFIRHHNISMGEKQAAKASAAEKALSRLDAVEKPFEPWRLRLSFGASERSGEVVFELRDVVFKRGAFTVGPISESIHFGERIGIVGANGTGKSTVVAAMLGQIEPVDGVLRRGSSVVIGTLDQARATFNQDASLIDAFTRTTSFTNTEARKLLAKFDLDAELVQHGCSQLTSGEQTRATMALLMAQKTNCLILDEPTNHLDLEATEQLEAALDSFAGTVIVISHDREFLKSVRLDRQLRLG